MLRDRNKICSTCIFYEEGRCRKKAPISFFPRDALLNNARDGNKNYRIHFDMPDLFPAAKAAGWCGEWSNGECEFCGRKE